MPIESASRPAGVLITGAGSGIGRSTALRLARNGWHVVAVDADAAALERLSAAWPADAIGPSMLVADLTDAAQIEALTRQLPPLEALINNAGMSGGGAEVLAGRSDDAARRLIALNLEAPARVVDACMPVLVPGARIVNVASGAGLRAIPWRGLYSASKAGLIAQTRALALAHPEWTVCALSPGFVRTELVQRLIDEGHLDPVEAVARIPLGRMAEPDDLAEALCLLASPGARTLRGQLLVVDGGSSIYGGSQPLPSAQHPALPFASTLSLGCEAIADAAWHAALANRDEHSVCDRARAASTYRAVVDGRAMQAAPGSVLQAVLAAARDFRERHAAQASLTLLLPPDSPELPWQQAGAAAAARMAIATLAVEWGARGLRINALAPAADCDPAECMPLLDYLAGPRAQFLTGQILRPGANVAGVKP